MIIINHYKLLQYNKHISTYLSICDNSFPSTLQHDISLILGSSAMLHSVLWGTVYHILICSTGMEDLRCYVN